MPNKSESRILKSIVDFAKENYKAPALGALLGSAALGGASYLKKHKNKEEERKALRKALLLGALFGGGSGLVLSRAWERSKGAPPFPQWYGAARWLPSHPLQTGAAAGTLAGLKHRMTERVPGLKNWFTGDRKMNAVLKDVMGEKGGNPLQIYDPVAMSRIKPALAQYIHLEPGKAHLTNNQITQLLEGLSARPGDAAGVAAKAMGMEGRDILKMLTGYEDFFSKLNISDAHKDILMRELSNEKGFRGLNAILGSGTPATTAPGTNPGGHHRLRVIPGQSPLSSDAIAQVEKSLQGLLMDRNRQVLSSVFEDFKGFSPDAPRTGLSKLWPDPTRALSRMRNVWADEGSRSSLGSRIADLSKAFVGAGKVTSPNLGRAGSAVPVDKAVSMMMKEPNAHPELLAEMHPAYRQIKPWQKGLNSGVGVAGSMLALDKLLTLVADEPIGGTKYENYVKSLK